MTESTQEKIARLKNEVTIAEAQLDREKMGRANKDNPFGDPDNPITPERLESLLKALGTKRTAEIAAAAGCRLDGSPIGSPYKSYRFRPDGSRIEDVA